MTVGDKVGRYLIRDPIGEGGMATVYRGEHDLLRHEVAIKLLHARHLNNADMERRFFNEARAIATLDHPGIVKLFDIGRADDGSAYVVMELLRGETLRERLAGDGVSLADSVVFARQIASALGAAHDAGIVHRDLKPDNVFVVEDDEVAGGHRTKVLDFGIAKRTEASGPITRSGVLLGTPTYMAPEQCAGLSASDVDRRVDVYALGVVMFEMVSGELPYEARSTEELVSQQLHCAPRDLKAITGELPGGLTDMVMRCLEVERDDRFAGMDEVCEALRRVELEVTGAAPPTPRQRTRRGDTEKVVPIDENADTGVRTGNWRVSPTSIRTIARRRRSRGGLSHRIAWTAGVLGIAAGVALAVAGATGHDNASREPSVGVAGPTTAPLPEPVLATERAQQLGGGPAILDRGPRSARAAAGAVEPDRAPSPGRAAASARDAARTRAATQRANRSGARSRLGDDERRQRAPGQHRTAAKKRAQARPQAAKPAPRAKSVADTAKRPDSFDDVDTPAVF